jgi:hypothetical protein
VAYELSKKHSDAVGGKPEGGAHQQPAFVG